MIFPYSYIYSIFLDHNVSSQKLEVETGDQGAPPKLPVHIGQDVAFPFLGFLDYIQLHSRRNFYFTDIMTTCGDDLCNGLKYVLEGHQLKQQQQHDQQQNDLELAIVPEVKQTAADNNFSLPETAPPPPSSSTEKSADETNTKKSTRATTSSSKQASAIRASIFMISGCEDSQTSADVSNVSNFSLPDPNGRAGGACTSALLKGTKQQYLIYRLT